VQQISHDPPPRPDPRDVRVDWPRDSKSQEPREEPREEPGEEPREEPRGEGPLPVRPSEPAKNPASNAAASTAAPEPHAGGAPGSRPASAEPGGVDPSARPARAADPAVPASSPQGQRPWSETSAVPHGVEPSIRPAPGFWFVLHTELVVSGATEPDATVTIQGVPVRLRPDGTFSVRFQLPDGEQSIPVVATSRDGAVRSITARVRRETSRFEKDSPVSGGETGPHGEAKSHGEDHGLDSFE
jgi:hypothetical protein